MLRGYIHKTKEIAVITASIHLVNAGYAPT